MNSLSQKLLTKELKIVPAAAKQWFGCQKIKMNQRRNRVKMKQEQQQFHLLQVYFLLHFLNYM